MISVLIVIVTSLIYTNSSSATKMHEIQQKCFKSDSCPKISFNNIIILFVPLNFPSDYKDLLKNCFIKNSALNKLFNIWILVK